MSRATRRRAKDDRISTEFQEIINDLIHWSVVLCLFDEDLSEADRIIEEERSYYWSRLYELLHNTPYKALVEDTGHIPFHKKPPTSSTVKFNILKRLSIELGNKEAVDRKLKELRKSAASKTETNGEVPCNTKTPS